MRSEELTAKRRKIKPWVLIVLALLAAVLLLLLGFRLRGWLQQGQDKGLTVLVNPWNGVSNSGFRPRPTALEGVQVDKSMKKALQRLLEGARSAGFTP